jgi:hypothetical protein
MRAALRLSPILRDLASGSHRAAIAVGPIPGAVSGALTFIMSKDGERRLQGTLASDPERLGRGHTDRRLGRESQGRLSCSRETHPSPPRRTIVLQGPRPPLPYKN